MSIIVQKFGGTSVATAEKIKAAAARAVAAHQSGRQVVMVVSARGKKTDELVGLAAEITDDPPPREMDMLLSTGEQESVALMAMAVRQAGVEAVSLTGGQIGVATDSSHTKARIRDISTDRMRQHLDAGAIVIACGFQGVDEQGNITTLGRGGSDTTATALAAVLAADVCEIYTDVDGVYTTDPRMVQDARRINRISYEEMLELASMGAGVMHSRSIEFAKKFGVPLRVRPSFSDGEGTLIVAESELGDAERVVSGVALVQKEARVTLENVPDRPGTLSVVFTKMAARKIAVDMVVQNVATAGSAEVSFTVPQDDLAEALTAAQEAIDELGTGAVRSGTNVAKVSAVGNGMRSHSGVAAQMFRSLQEADVNVGMITTSEIKLSVLVDRDICEQALLAVHRGFHLAEEDSTPPGIGLPQHVSRPTEAAAREAFEREVVSRLTAMEDIVVSEVDLDDRQSRVTINNLPDVPGVVADLFTAVAEGDVMVDVIVQNVSHSGHASVSFTVNRDDLDRCLLLVREVAGQWEGADITSEREIAKLSVMGIGLRTHTGVGETLFRTLSEQQINVKLVNTSETRMSVIVDYAQGSAAQAAVAKAFGLA